MSVLVFRLRHVPEDEAQAVRSLLDSHNIEWFETTAGNWGIAMPGLWVTDDESAILARNLIEAYQKERTDSMQSYYQSEKAAGRTVTFLDQLKRRPLQVIGIVLFCVFIVYVMIDPFVSLIGH